MEKKILISKLDSLVSEIVASRGYCEKCGHGGDLQNHHIFYRRYMSTRFDLDNCILLCKKCHNFAHSHKRKFEEFAKIQLGDKYEILKEKFREITKLSEDDLQCKYEILKEIHEEHVGNR